MTSKQRLILHEIGYEWWMLKSMVHLLSRLPEGPDPVRNALVEALVIHARAQVDFFFIPGKGQVRVTDLKSDDLGIQRIAPPTAVVDWKEAVNKHVVHLTTIRHNKISIWDSRLILELLEERHAKMFELLGSEIDENWIGNWPISTSLLAETSTMEQERDTSVFGPTLPAAPTSGR